MARVIVGSLLLLACIFSLYLMTLTGHAYPPAKLATDTAMFAGPGIVLLVWGLVAVRRNRGLPRPPGRVYWWRTQSLLSQVEEGTVDQLSYLRYLLSYTVLDLFSWGLDTEVFTFTWNNDRKYAASLGMAIILTKLLGPFLAYLANGGSRGTLFLQKLVACSHPVRVRAMAVLLVALPLILCISGFLKGFLHLDQLSLFRGTAAGVFWACFNILHYGLICSSFKKFRAQLRARARRPA